MTDLANKKCVPCEGGIPNFDITEIHKYLKMVDGWKVESDENKIYFLIKKFNFKKATNFNTYGISGHSSVVERLVANEEVINPKLLLILIFFI